MLADLPNSSLRMYFSALSGSSECLQVIYKLLDLAVRWSWLTASANPKRFFAYLKRRSNVGSSIPVLLGSDGATATTDHEKACLLSAQYAGTFVQDEQLPHLDLAMTVPQDSCLTHVTISEAKVLHLLQALNPANSAGMDDIHPKLLYELASELCGPVTRLFQLSLRSCSFPKDWKDAIVCPIFKKGDKHLANYRPVSLTSVLVKVLEKLVSDVLEDHLREYGLLSPLQHGFRKGHSCMTNLLVARECWADALDRGHAVDVVFIDFSKAFDTVSHSLLSLKLRSYGISGGVLKWITTFLEGREMCVRVGSSLSFRQSVLSGVPQGSVLGPLLFSLYVNELPELLEVPSLMFADDLKFWHIVSDFDGPQTLQRALDKLWDWAALWQLPINYAKCSILRVGPNSPQTRYFLGGNELHHVTQLVDLGVTLSSELKSSENWRKATCKGFRMLWMIRRAFETITGAMFVRLFSAFVRPYLEYCIQACPPCLVRDRMSVERMLRVGTKLVHGLRNHSYPKRLLALGMFSMHYRQHQGDLVLTYRILTGKIGPDLSGLFQPARLPSLRGHSLKQTNLDRMESGRTFVYHAEWWIPGMHCPKT
ncbi:unnamed protein product, partial [Dicrocoelium dendriticum]